MDSASVPCTRWTSPRCLPTMSCNRTPRGLFSRASTGGNTISRKFHTAPSPLRFDSNLICKSQLFMWRNLQQLDWVCDNAFLPTLSQSIFFCGAIVGGLLFGWIADRYGRIPALAGCNLIGFVAGKLIAGYFKCRFQKSLILTGVATAFTGSFLQFSLCRFLVGFAFDNCFTMMYILGKWFGVVIGQVGKKNSTCPSTLHCPRQRNAFCAKPSRSANFASWNRPETSKCEFYRWADHYSSITGSACSCTTNLDVQ